MFSNLRHKMEREWFGVLTRFGQGIFYLFNLCYGGFFLSYLPRYGVCTLGERYFYREETQRF